MSSAVDAGDGAGHQAAHQQARHRGVAVGEVEVVVRRVLAVHRVVVLSRARACRPGPCRRSPGSPARRRPAPAPRRRRRRTGRACASGRGHSTPASSFRCFDDEVGVAHAREPRLLLGGREAGHRVGASRCSRRARSRCTASLKGAAAWNASSRTSPTTRRSAPKVSLSKNVRRPQAERLVEPRVEHLVVAARRRCPAR